jgi:hypothetical protein
MYANPARLVPRIVLVTLLCGRKAIGESAIIRPPYWLVLMATVHVEGDLAVETRCVERGIQVSCPLISYGKLLYNSCVQVPFVLCVMMVRLSVNHSKCEACGDSSATLGTFAVIVAVLIVIIAAAVAYLIIHSNKIKNMTELYSAIFDLHKAWCARSDGEKPRETGSYRCNQIQVSSETQCHDVANSVHHAIRTQLEVFRCAHSSRGCSGRFQYWHESFLAL